MTKSIDTVTQGDADTAAVLRDQSEVEARIRAICFKTGPPALLGVELEWTLHHTSAPAAPLRAGTLWRALGQPPPPRPLPAGGSLSVEPGGQLEISSAPAASLPALRAAVDADRAHLDDLLAPAGLTLGRHGIDPHRAPGRLVRSPRYDAMEDTFDARGPAGRVMMCSTAGLQLCVDAGTAGELTVRWAAAAALGPPLLALFANSRRHAGRDTGLASARMAAWQAMDPRLTGPVGAETVPHDPAGAWVRYALAAPLVCVRRDGGRWTAPAGVTLADWARGALPRRPTTADVDYHLSTLFPPVRPRGYLEVRYLDAQPGDDWIVPAAVLAALLADPAVTGRALDLALPTAGRWTEAARLGLADPALRRTAAAVADLAGRHLAATGLEPDVRDHITDSVEARLAAADHGESR